MAPFSRSHRERLQAEEAAKRAREQKQQEDAAEEAERQTKKLERELAELEAKGKVDPPPELPPAERLARENAERLDQLEGNQRLAERGLTGANLRPLESPEEARRKEALQDLSKRRDVEKQEQHERELGIASRQKKFEDQTDAITERRLTTERAAEATCREALADARERADAEREAADKSYAEDMVAKLAKADPEVRQLLERLNPKLRELQKVMV
jgi:hypothetical protein